MVINIEEYPQFLPNCSHLDIKNHQKIDKIDHFTAEMGVKFASFTEKFTSNVVANQKKNSILVSLSSGPLKNLSNQWQFEKHENGCMANFSIEIEMKNLVLRLALAAAFKVGVNDITNAFITRADTLYKSSK